MLRAVPATMLMAVSTQLAFRSAILISAISRTCSLVTDPTLFLLGAPEALANLAGALQQDRGGRALGDEGEAAVLKDADDDRDDQALLFLGAFIELLAEVHDVYHRAGPTRARRVARDWPAPRDTAT